MATILKRKHSDMHVRASLLTLPAELREAIWTMAVAETQPLVAYVDRRTIRRPQEEECTGDDRSLMRQCRRQPGNPPLAYVNKQVRDETMTIFIRENVFAFSLDTQVSDEVESWEALTEWAPQSPVGRGFDDSFGRLDRIWTVRIESLISTAVSLLDHDHKKAATVELKLDSSGSLLLSFGGALLAKCTCHLLRRATNMKEIAIQTPDDVSLIAQYSSSLERQNRTDWNSADRFEAHILCEACGKMVGEELDTRARRAAKASGR